MSKKAPLPTGGGRYTVKSGKLTRQQGTEPAPPGARKPAETPEPKQTPERDKA